MKKKLFQLKAICVLILLSFFSPVHAQINSDFKDKFTLGAFNYFPYSPDSFYANSTQINYYKELSFNFLEGHSGDGGYDYALLGFFPHPINTYWNNVNSLLNTWQTNFGNYSTIMADDKIAKPCYGQLSIYQAENRGTWNSVAPGYGYQGTGVGNDTVEIWSGQNIECVRVKKGRHTSGYILKDLYENKEQVNWNWSPSYMNDINTVWFIKPKMRIDPTFALSNPDTAVVAIIIKDFWGVTQDSIIITCAQFIQSGSYDGTFREAYNYPGISPYRLSFQGSELVNTTVTENNMDFSKVDYQIYWFGKCDVSIDYVKVDNEIANFLFNPAFDPNDYNYSYVKKILNATDSFTTGTYNGGKRYSYFYLDEFEYNMIPAIAEVNRLIDSINPSSGVICLFSQNKSDWWLKTSLRNIPTYPEALEYLKSSGAIEDIFFSEPYPFEDWIPLPPNISLPDTNVYKRTNHYWNAASNNVYNDSMNNFMERNHMRNFRDVSQAVKNTNIIFSLCTQVHSFEEYWLQNKYDSKYYVLREPLNEEIKMQNYLALAYGAKQVIYFIYQSFYNKTSDFSHNYGLLEFPTGSMTKRETNYYGQKKWDSLARHDSALVKMGKYIAEEKKLLWDAARTVYFEALPFKYVDNIKSIYSDPSALRVGVNNVDFNEDTKKYWELGFYDANSSVEPATSAYTKYFLAVNKRCTPNMSNDGDIRTLQVKFRSTDLPMFNNWKLYDAMTNTLMGTFDKNGTGYISAGSFQPGEGKLFKLIPVMIDGGALVADENLYNISFNCNAPVYTNGNDLLFREGVNISFAPEAKVVMHQGTFQCGFDASLTDRTTYDTCRFTAQNPSRGWGGMQFDSTNIKLNYTKFVNVRRKSYNHNATIYSFNAPELTLNHSKILPLSDGDSSTTGILSIYGSSLPFSPEITITNNRIESNNYYYGIDVEAYTSRSGDFYFGDNYLSNSIGAGIGFLLVNLENPLLYNNQIFNWYQSIYASNTSPGLWANYISSPPNYRLLRGENESFFDMSSNIGGYNTFWGNVGICVSVDDSYFYTRNGGNIYDIQNTSTGYFFKGKFSSDIVSASQDARSNCFTTGEWVQMTDSATIHARMDVKLSDNTTPVGFRLSNYLCTSLPDKLNISKKQVSAENLQKNSVMPNSLSKTSSETDKNSPGYTEEKLVLSEELYSLMKADLKDDNYSSAAEKCAAILELGLEDMFSVDAVKKLFHSVSLQKEGTSKEKESKQKMFEKVNKNLKTNDLNQTKLSKTVSVNNRTGSSVNSIQGLKSFFESYIQSHPQNKHVIGEMFYYIQKCKVNLGDYESALNGYKAIMDQNPSSMKGLNAKWEYMMLSQNTKNNGKQYSGKGGGENELLTPNELTDEQRHEKLISLIEDNNEEPKDGPKDGRKDGRKDGKDKYDTKKFTKEDRKIITTNIINSLESNDQRDKKTLKVLEEKVRNNQADVSEAVEYKKRNLIRELTRIEKTSTADELVSIIQNDIRKILELDGKPSEITQERITPEVAFDYKLNQNYPNPFNPSTKINYELKNAGFVSLKIYDLLGREIAELVNDTKDAGRYSIDFNASKYMMASGIYFYRIKAGEFVDTKRMVLVK